MTSPPAAFLGDFASIAVFTAAMKAFLSNEPAGCASIESTFEAFAWPARSSEGACAASCASLAFAEAGGCAFLAAAKPLTFSVTCMNAGSAAATAAIAGAGAGFGPFGPPPAAGFEPALPSLDFAGTGLAGGVGFFAGTAFGPKPVVVTARADAGGFGPSSVTGTPADWAALSPFSTVSIAGSSPRTSFSAASM